MESQRMHKVQCPPELPVKTQTSDTKRQTIKRPPNAFMLFACEHRSNLSKEYPGVGNKEISTLLGQKWASLPPDIRKIYEEKAEKAKQLHKLQYPDYRYCPVEARERKKKKQKLKEEAFMKAGGKRKKVEEHENYPGEEQKNDFNDNATVDSYVPNNPDYLIEPDPDDVSDNPNKRFYNERDEIPRSSFNRNESGLSRYYTSSNLVDGARYLPEDMQCSQSGRSASCSPTEHYPCLESPLFCEPPICCNPVPHDVPPSYYPFYSSRAIASPFYCQGRHDNYEESKPYVHCPSQYYSPPSAYFHKSALPYYRNSGFGYYPHFKPVMAHSHIMEEGFPVQNSQFRHPLHRLDESLCPKFSNYDDRLRASGSGHHATTHFPNITQTKFKADISKCPSYFAHFAGGYQDGNKNNDARRCCNEYTSTESVRNNSVQDEDIDILSESEEQMHKESYNVHENESRKQRIVSSSLENNESSVAQNSYSQSQRDHPHESFDKGIMPNIKNCQILRMHHPISQQLIPKLTPIPISSQQSNPILLQQSSYSTLKNEIGTPILNSGSAGEKAKVETNGTYDTLHANIDEKKRVIQML